jgi:hypothetical protein
MPDTTDPLALHRLLEAALVTLERAAETPGIAQTIYDAGYRIPTDAPAADYHCDPGRCAVAWYLSNRLGHHVRVSGTTARVFAYPDPTAPYLAVAGLPFEVTMFVTDFDQGDHDALFQVTS